MTRGVKFRRGSTSDHSGYTGLEGEITVNTDKDCLVVHDGATVGGFEQVSLASTQTLTNKTLTSPTISSPTITGAATVSILGVTGISTAGNLSVIGVSTFTNGPILIGTATSTGTSSQPLQVNGGAYFNGLVGIGTTNPTVALQLSPDARISNLNANTSLSSTAGVAATVAQFYHLNGNASYLRIKATRNTSGSDWTTASTKLLQVIDVTEQGYIEFNPNGANYGLAFGQGSNEYMRILNGGNVLIGTTSSTGTASQTLQVNGGAYFSGSVGIGTTNPTAKLNLAAGTASANTSPLKFSSGVVLTTPESGAIEYDGHVFYATPKAGGRGAILTPEYYVLNADRTGPATLNTPINLFDVTSTLKAGVRYLIEFYFTLQKPAAVAAIMNFATTSTGGTVDRSIYRTIGAVTATNRFAVANGQVASNNLAGHVSNIAITGTNSNAAFYDAQGRIWVDVNTGGDVTGYSIQVSTTATTATTILAGANVSIYPIGPVGGNTSIGSWA